MLWEHKLQANVSTAFSSSPNLSRVFLLLDRNTVYIFSISFRKHLQEEKESNLLIIFSLLAPSLRQQRRRVTSVSPWSC